MILLDTSFLILSMLPGSREDAQLRIWLRSREQLAISTIALAEFLCGPVQPAQREFVDRFIPEQLPFEGSDAEVAAQLFNLGGRRRGSLVDCMIAATALRVSGTLATANPGDFLRYKSHGLSVLSA